MFDVSGVRWAPRRGLREEEGFSGAAKSWKLGAPVFAERRMHIGYLRRNRYAFVARNYTLRGIKGEVYLVGYDGDTLAFVEVRMRSACKCSKIPV